MHHAHVIDIFLKIIVKSHFGGNLPGVASYMGGVHFCVFVTGIDKVCTEFEQAFNFFVIDYSLTPQFLISDF